jgi:hypothetical protein
MLAQSLNLLSALTLASTIGWATTGAPYSNGSAAQIWPESSRDNGAFFAWDDGNGNAFCSRITSGGQVEIPSGLTPVPVSPVDNRSFCYGTVRDGDDGAYIVWSYDRSDFYVGQDLYLLRVRSDMSPAPGWTTAGIAIDDSPLDLNQAVLAADGEGGVFVAWDCLTQDARFAFSGPDTVRLQRIRADGSRCPGWPERGVVISVDAGHVSVERVIADGSGGAYTVARGDFYQGRVQHVAANGTIPSGWPIGGRPVKPLITPWDDYYYNWCAVPDGQGGIFVTWDDTRRMPANPPPNTYYADIFVQRIMPDGSNAPGWPANGLALTSGPGDHINPRICPDGSGGAYVAWREYYAPGYPMLTRVTANGAQSPGWPFGGTIVCSRYGEEPLPASDGQGGAFVAWNDGSRDWVQHLRGDATLAPGYAITGTLLVDLPGSGQGRPSMIASTPGSAIVTWPDARQGTPTYTLRAQRLIDDGLVPIALTLRSSDADADHVHLVWWGAAAAQGTYSVERSADGVTWEALGVPHASSQDQLDFDDRAVTPSSRYAYRLADAQGHALAALTWVDVPARAEFSLAGARPDPAPLGQLSVAFSLPAQATGALELLDVAGRRVAWRELGSLGAGRHVLSMPETASLAPGVHWLRLSQGARQAVKRVVLVR